MQVRLLGPVDVVLDGVPRPVPGLRRRAILAMLALRRGEVVSTDRLIDTVWSDGAPSTLNTIQANVSHLRGVLGTRTAILARAPGYVLAGAGEPTDVELAEQLIEQATGAAPATDQVRHLRTALALWRGPSLVDVAEVPWLDAQARRLDQLRLRARRALAEARLALGEHDELVPELHRLAEEYPYDEQIHGHLILALYRSGRPSEALETYQRLRTGLADELGVDPGPALRALEAAILRHDPELATPVPPVVVAPAPAAQVPAQLPAGVRGFAGRRAELAALDALLGGTPGEGSAAIATLSGSAGVGKTSLAVHWARLAAEH
ncbi:MAG TPA: BTAD domain-containing putative transcriptional regulator, partial [Rugosimonospora sp.]|nr:BTAD domain-containing putative transcriptional regulator [Rugosimonospora sp.]